MSTQLTGKTAIVTGASKGIGVAIAKTLAAAGASVVVNYAASKEAAKQVVADITTAGGRAIAVQADVSKPADVERLFAESQEAFGSLDILVNNAGVFDFQPLEAVTEEEFHRQFNLNTLGPILTSQQALKYFGSEGGSIINVSTIASANPTPYSVIYAASKSALDSVTRGLAKELGGRKIRVNGIAPGAVDTEGMQRLGVIGSPYEQQVISETPLGRFGQPDDIARVALFLASDESAWVTGERITVSGGWR